ncbi:MAG: tetratricopeptide repeat protein [Planctomycetes bacterium]|nr:tetratricopeptide repeat protein [Planctomycetota bacterium]
MAPIASFFTGFFGVSLVSFLLRLVAEVRPTSAAALIGVAAFLAAGALLAAFVPRVEHRLVRVIGAIAFVGLALVLRGSIESIRHADGPWMLGAIVAGAFVAARMQGGGSLEPGLVLLGAALGLLAQDWLFLPLFPFGDWLVLASVLLCATRQIGEGATKDESVRDERGWSSRLLEPALAGIAIGFALALARPFLLQQTSGLRFSHEVVGVVLLLGIALGAFLRLRRYPGPIARVVTALLGIAALGAMFRVQLIRGSSARAMQETWLGDHPIGSEFRAVQILAGLASVAAGAWLTNVLGARIRPLAAAAVFSGAAIGAIGATHALADGAKAWPTRLFGEPRALVREGPLEIYAGHRITEDGVLRSVRNMTQAEGAHHLQWHNRRTTRIPTFAGLESQEIFTPAEITHGTSLLLVGNVTAHHRESIGATTFGRYAIVPTIPLLDRTMFGDERHASFTELIAESARFDVITFVSTPNLDDESARMLTRERFRDAKALLAERGSVFVWLDLQAIGLDEVAAVGRALAAEFSTIRTWLTADGFAGPFVGFEAGSLPAAGDTGFRVQLPASTLLDVGGTRANSVLDPIVELMRPTAKLERTLPSEARLRALAARVRAATSGTDRAAVGEAVASILDALAQHVIDYFDVELLNAKSERDRLTEPQADAMAKAIASAPSVPFVHQAVLNFIVFAFAKKNYELCDRVLLPALAAHPDDEDLRLISGRINFELLDDEAAIEDLEFVVSAGHATAEAYRVLGMAYHRSKDLPAALSALEAALQVAPEDFSVLRAFGLCLADTEEGSKAIPILQRVLTQNPKDKEVRAKLLQLEPNAVLPLEPETQNEFPHDDK